jgi:steroid delta-isomerase-like uncharacterized protein
MSDENKAIARRIMEVAWSKGDLSVVDECVSIDCRLHDPVFPQVTAGAGSLKEHITACREAFPDLRFSVDDMVAERDEVVIHWTARGTHRGGFLGMAPTNRSATITGTSIFRIENEKLIENWSDWNLLSLLQQLGISMVPKMESHEG